MENQENNFQEEKNAFEEKKFIDTMNILFETQKKEYEEKIKKQDQSIFYLKSDIENIKRNTTKEIEQATNKMTIKILSSFLSVLDDYERS